MQIKHIEQMQIKHATTKPVIEILCLHDWINGEKMDLRRPKFIENYLGGDMYYVLVIWSIVCIGHI